MDTSSLLPLLGPGRQTSLSGSTRMPAESGNTDAPTGVHGFAHMLKSMVSPGCTAHSGRIDPRLAGGDAGPTADLPAERAARQGDEVLPPSLDLLQPSLAAVVAPPPPPLEVPATPPEVATLLQWLVQMAPQGGSATLADATGRHPGEAGLGRMDMGAQTEAGQAPTGTPGRGLATTAFAFAPARGDARLEPVAGAAGAAGALPVAFAPERGEVSAGAHPPILLAGGDAAQQMVAAAAPAVPTATVTAAGSPVVAPAQTWIQTPVTQPGFSDEVVVALVRRVGQAEQGPQAVTLHLNPEALGPVSVSIELSGNAARIEFGASEGLTRHHLEAALPGLAEALREQGVLLVHGQVHEASQESLAADADAAGGRASAGSGGPGSDARAQGDAPTDGHANPGGRGLRREPDRSRGDGPVLAERREPGALGPAPGRAGRLDLVA